RNNIVEEAIRLFNQNDRMILVITPEGTRHKVRQWKKGFYVISERAKVPIAMAFIDYGKHSGGVGPIFYPSGNYEEDLPEIQKFYVGMTPRHPERFALITK
ncbi:MAG: acyltransferase, partial [Bacteroidota bacterium]|nr:acyltransferase [Bacteroidota bacterium]